MTHDKQTMHSKFQKDLVFCRSCVKHSSEGQSILPKTVLSRGLFFCAGTTQLGVSLKSLYKMFNLSQTSEIQTHVKQTDSVGVFDLVS